MLVLRLFSAFQFLHRCLFAPPHNQLPNRNSPFSFRIPLFLTFLFPISTSSKVLSDTLFFFFGRFARSSFSKASQSIDPPTQSRSFPPPYTLVVPLIELYPSSPIVPWAKPPLHHKRPIRVFDSSGGFFPRPKAPVPLFVLSRFS